MKIATGIGGAASDHEDDHENGKPHTPAHPYTRINEGLIPTLNYTIFFNSVSGGTLLFAASSKVGSCRLPEKRDFDI